MSYDLPDNFARRVAAARLLPQDSEIVVDGPRLHRHEVESAGGAAHQLFVALCELFETRFGGSYEAFGQATGHSPVDVEVYRWDGGCYAPETLARVDAVRSGEGLKFVEFNIGSSLGGLEDASLPYLLGLPQREPPIVAWGEYMARRVAPGSHGVLIEEAGLLDDEMRRSLEAMAGHLSTTAGLDVQVCHQHELHWNGTDLQAVGHRVDWVYPFFYPHDVHAAPGSYEALRKALQARAVAMPIPHVAKLFGSKLVLAFLHEAAAAEPAGSPLRRLVEQWVAWTVRFEPSLLNMAAEDRMRLVLKPAVGLGGSGVVVGAEQSSEAWRSALLSALGGAAGAYVLQRFHRPPIEQVVTRHPKQGQRTWAARSVWGIYVLDGRTGGVPFLRCIPEQGSAVINAARGAVVGGTPML